MHVEEEYKLLPADPADPLEDVGEAAEAEASLQICCRRHSLVRLVIVQSIVIICLSATIFWVAWPRTSLPSHQHLFCECNSSIRCSYITHLLVTAPADEAVAYEEVVFRADFHSKTTYTRYPTSEVDQAWNNLYNGEPICWTAAKEYIIYANTFRLRYL